MKVFHTEKEKVAKKTVESESNDNESDTVATENIHGTQQA
jgi:hypothetical protein